MKAEDLASFHCSDECEDLCGSPVKQRAVIRLSELYPGLTNSERALAGQEPVKSLRAYKLSWKAEALCNEIYGNSRHNDESDACRHFVWAAIMSHYLGKEFAKKVLDAHEQEPEQPDEERKMDEFNNGKGLSVDERLRRQGKFTDLSVIEDFKAQLKSRKLIVLRPRSSQGVTK